MRPESPEIREFTTIKVYSDISGDIKEYSHHAIEIFKEHGKYKVLDILHSDKVVWLETYLDELCKVNHCQRGQLRYDFGYLAPCHAFASNMQELSDLMRYLDKTYCIGKPRVTLMNLGEESPSGILIKPTVGVNKNSPKKGRKIPHLRVKNYTGLVVANPRNFSWRCFIL
ncbi:MAG: hypothetical protein SOZ71_06520 [Clostridium sp.]|nr:hypothetical protein [Clostridium sp.]